MQCRNPDRGDVFLCECTTSRTNRTGCCPSNNIDRTKLDTRRIGLSWERVSCLVCLREGVREVARQLNPRRRLRPAAWGCESLRRFDSGWWTLRKRGVEGWGEQKAAVIQYNLKQCADSIGGLIKESGLSRHHHHHHHCHKYTVTSWNRIRLATTTANVRARNRTFLPPTKVHLLRFLLLFLLLHLPLPSPPPRPLLPPRLPLPLRKQLQQHPDIRRFPSVLPLHPRHCFVPAAAVNRFTHTTCRRRPPPRTQRSGDIIITTPFPILPVQHLPRYHRQCLPPFHRRVTGMDPRATD